MRKNIILLILLVLCAVSASAQDECTVYFNNSWLEHNVTKSNGSQTAKGMEIHCDFSIEGMQGKTLCVIAYFAIKDGDEYIPLQSRTGNNQFRSRDNCLCTGGFAYCKYETTYWDDFILFLPYYELARALSGDAELSCIVQVQSKSGETYAFSEKMDFNFNKN